MLRVSVARVACIVSSPPPLPEGFTRRVLVVPANEELVGTRLAYFPNVGMERGAQPQWGGADIAGYGGAGAYYPVQVVDGIVGQLGGSQIRDVCEKMPVLMESEVDGITGTTPIRCPTGQAVITNAPSRLGEHFFKLVHAVPPLWPKGTIASDKEQTLAEREKHAELLLYSAYDSAFKHASILPEFSVLLSPLLGCGARGAPATMSIRTAVKAAKKAATSLSDSSTGVRMIQFALQDPELLSSLETKLSEAGLL